MKMERLDEYAGIVLVFLGCLMMAAALCYLIVHFGGKLVNEWHDAKLRYDGKRICDDIYEHIHKLESDVYRLKCEHIENHKNQGASET